MKRIILSAALAVSLYGCQSDESAPLSTNDGPVAVEFTEVGNNEMMGSENFTASNLVIDNEADWNALKMQMDAYNHFSAGFTETDIDFAAYRIIAVIDEVRLSGGYDIFVTAVTESDRQVVVDVQHTEGGAGAGATVITQPFHIVKIPQGDLPVVFE